MRCALRVVENDSAAIVIKRLESSAKVRHVQRRGFSEITGLTIVLHIPACRMLASDVTAYSRLYPRYIP
jgi:hypothetical protein